MMFQLKQGWTKAAVLAQFKKYNNGTVAKSRGVCAYRNAGGNRCAVGAFIPSHFSHAMTFRGLVSSLLVKYPDLRHYMPFESELALASMQCAHDDALVNGSTHDRLERWLNENVEEKETK